MRFAPASFWKASLFGQKIVRSERVSRGSTSFAEVAAPARAVKFPDMRVSERLRGIRRSLSIMCRMPLLNSMSWISVVSAGSGTGRRGFAPLVGLERDLRL